MLLAVQIPEELRSFAGFFVSKGYNVWGAWKRDGKLSIAFWIFELEEGYMGLHGPTLRDYALALFGPNAIERSRDTNHCGCLIYILRDISKEDIQVGLQSLAVRRDANQQSLEEFAKLDREARRVTPYVKGLNRFLPQVDPLLKQMWLEIDALLPGGPSPK